MAESKEVIEMRKLLARWRRSPHLWVKDNFPTVNLSTQQKEYFVALGDLVNAKIRLANGQALTEEQGALAHKVGISISAGQGVGKDFVTALTIFWFLWCNPVAEKHPKWNEKDRPKVVATGVNAKHLRNVLWAELSKIMMLSKATDPDGENPILKELFEWKTERLEYKDKRFDNWFAEAITINSNASEEEQARTLYGRHAHSMLIVADEAAGMPDCVFTTMEGTMTDPVNIALMIFNPIKTKGYAIRSQNEEADKWVTLRWDAEASELVSRESIDHKRKYGEDSYEWRVLVKGLPPLVEQNTLIPPDWILSAVDRDVGDCSGRGVIVGADISGGGDRSVVCVRHGDRVQLLESKMSPDTTVTEDWIFAHVLREQAGCTVVDNVGIGAGVYDRLSKRVTTRKGDARQTPKDERFYNRRAEVYWHLREKFENGAISIPDDSELINEISSIIYDPQNKCKIGDKKELRKKLGGASPDKCFVAGTMIETLYGDLPIEEISSGMYVLTSNGYRRVIKSGCTGYAAVSTIILSNGTKILATDSHPIFINGKGFTPLRNVMLNDIVSVSNEGGIVWNLKIVLSGMGTFLKYFLSQSSYTYKTIIGRIGVRKHISLIQYVKNAVRHLKLLLPKYRNIAPIHVQNVTTGAQKEKVYNLTVQDAHEYYANGILVHNCDALALSYYVDDMHYTKEGRRNNGNKIDFTGIFLR